MKKIKLISVLFLLSTFTRINAQDPGEITQKAMDVSDIASYEMTSSLTTYDAKGNKRVREMVMASKKFGETNKVLLKFTAPANVKGTGILIYDNKNKDDDMWVYMPALRKTRRIISSEKSKSFMGSEFSNADMSRPTLDDFNYKLIGSDVYNGKNCWVVESTPKTEKVADQNGYSKKISWIDKDDYYMYKTEYYDLDGDLWKVMTLSDYQPLGKGKAMARKMEIENKQNDRKSVFAISRIQVGSSLTENSFTVAMLEK